MRIDQRLAEILNTDYLEFPEDSHVIGIQYERYDDWSGDDAVRVFIIFDEATTDEERGWPAVYPLTEKIRRALYDAEIDTWPYFRYRKASEMPSGRL